MTVSAEKLLRMAGQIAANVTVSDDPEVIAERTADHLNRFWDARMRNQLANSAIDNNEISDLIRMIIAKVRTTPGPSRQ